MAIIVSQFLIAPPPPHLLLLSQGLRLIREDEVVSRRRLRRLARLLPWRNKATPTVRHA
jgi:hypothetical protein